METSVFLLGVLVGILICYVVLRVQGEKLTRALVITAVIGLVIASIGALIASPVTIHKEVNSEVKELYELPEQFVEMSISNASTETRFRVELGLISFTCKLKMP